MSEYDFNIFSHIAAGRLEHPTSCGHRLDVSAPCSCGVEAIELACQVPRIATARIVRALLRAEHRIHEALERCDPATLPGELRAADAALHEVLIEELPHLGLHAVRR